MGEGLGWGCGPGPEGLGFDRLGAIQLPSPRRGACTPNPALPPSRGKGSLGRSRGPQATRHPSGRTGADREPRPGPGGDRGGAGRRGWTRRRQARRAGRGDRRPPGRARAPVGQPGGPEAGACAGALAGDRGRPERPRRRRLDRRLHRGLPGSWRCEGICGRCRPGPAARQAPRRSADRRSPSHGRPEPRPHSHPRSGGLDRLRHQLHRARKGAAGGPRPGPAGRGPRGPGQAAVRGRAGASGQGRDRP